MQRIAHVAATINREAFEQMHGPWKDDMSLTVEWEYQGDTYRVVGLRPRLVDDGEAVRIDTATARFVTRLAPKPR
jgi:hypothetical protein